MPCPTSSRACVADAEPTCCLTESPVLLALSCATGAVRCVPPPGHIRCVPGSATSLARSRVGTYTTRMRVVPVEQNLTTISPWRSLTRQTARCHTPWLSSSHAVPTGHAAGSTSAPDLSKVHVRGILCSLGAVAQPSARQLTCVPLRATRADTSPRGTPTACPPSPSWTRPPPPRISATRSSSGVSPRVCVSPPVPTPSTTAHPHSLPSCSSQSSPRGQAAATSAASPVASGCRRATFAPASRRPPPSPSVPPASWPPPLNIGGTGLSSDSSLSLGRDGDAEPSLPSRSTASSRSIHAIASHASAVPATGYPNHGSNFCPDRRCPQSFGP